MSPFCILDTQVLLFYYIVTVIMLGVNFWSGLVYLYIYVLKH